MRASHPITRQLTIALIAATAAATLASGCSASKQAEQDQKPAPQGRAQLAQEQDTRGVAATDAPADVAPSPDTSAATRARRSPVATTGSTSATPPPAPAKVTIANNKVVTKSDKKKHVEYKFESGEVSGNLVHPSAAKDAPATEPSDSDARGEEYTHHGVNPMTETAKDRFSTFSIDVDTGAYTVTRRKLNEGHLPPAAAVRVEEFVNYFGYNYPSPDSGAFGVSLEAAPSPFSTDKKRHIVRVGVQGRRIPASQRKPVHLTFLVDVSGSMNTSDKLGLARQSLKVLTNNLKPGDTVALATYAGRTEAILQPTSVTERGKILGAIDRLTSGGGTSMGSGMELAYKMALTNFKRDHVNRVIVLSDGDANIGPTSQSEILRKIKSYVDEGVTLSTIGLGMGNYRDTLMEQLANKGNGNYYYIDSIAEARKVFGEQLDGTLEVIAKDVKIQVEFNPKAVSQYRLIGYENRDIADRDFRNDKVDAGEIGSGHTVTALYEVDLDTDYKAGALAFVRVRHKQPQGHTATEQTFTLKRHDVRAKLKDASKDFQFAAAVAGFAELLRGSPYAKNLSFALVEEVARGASSPNQKDRQEFIGLVQRARRLKKG